MSTAELAGRIRQARTDAGLSQAQLAQRLGVSQSRISRWESGRIRLREPRVAELLAMLGHTPDTRRPERSPRCSA